MKSMIFTSVCKNDSTLDLINAIVGSLTAKFKPCKYYDINDILTLNLNFLSVMLTYCTFSTKKILTHCENFCVHSAIFPVAILTRKQWGP